MLSPARDRSLSRVSGLYATKPGCISMAILTPWSLANCACLVQYGVTFFSHCQSSASRYSGGQGQVIQLGYFALLLSPGQPEKSITTGTPSFSARRTVLRLVSWNAFAKAEFGCSGFPWQLSALMEKPRSSSLSLNSRSALRSVSIDNGQCGSPG